MSARNVTGGDPDPAAAAAGSPSAWMMRLKQQQSEKRMAKAAAAPPSAADLESSALAKRQRDYDARMAAPGNMDDETYDKVVWGLGVLPASGTKDRLARTWDATVNSLSFTYAGLTPREIELLAKALVWNDSLTHLDLGWNRLDVAAIATLVAALKENSVLQALRLWNNPAIGDEGAAHISGLLKINSSISALDLSVAGLTEAGAGYLNSALARNTTLASLFLSRNALGDAGVCRLVAEKDGTFISLKTLGLSAVLMGDEGATAVGRYIHGSFCITALDLSHNPIRYTGIDALAEALSLNKSLAVFDISNCGFGPAGAITFATHIQNFRFLRELNLYGNAIGDEGVRALARPLASCRQLFTLDLSHNGLTCEAGRELGYLLHETKALRKLRLCDNALGAVGVVDIAEALRRNSTLTSLDITNNQLGHVGAARFKYAKERNSRFREWYARAHNKIIYITSIAIVHVLCGGVQGIVCLICVITAALRGAIQLHCSQASNFEKSKNT